MKKFTYLMNGNKLYKVMDIYQNILRIKVIEHKLSRDDCKHTYDITQLESLGFIIEPMGIKRCVL